MNFVCNIVDVAGIEPTFKLVWLSPPISCLTISRPPVVNSVLLNFVNYLRRQALCTLADTSWLTI